MNQKKHYLPLVISFFLFIFCITFLLFTDSPRILKGYNGVCDLSDFSFSDGDYYSIGRCFAKNASKDISGLKAYTLDLTIPEGCGTIAFRIPSIFSYCKFYINNNLAYFYSGFESTQAAAPQIILYEPNTTHISLKILMENSDESTHSPLTNLTLSPNLYIGNVNGIYHNKELSFFNDVVLFLICTISALFHLVTYIYRGRTKTHLYFSLISLATGLYILFSGEFIIWEYLPTIPMMFSIRIKLFSYMIRILAVMLYARNEFKDYILNFPFIVFHIINLVLTICIFVLPIYGLFFLFPMYHIVSIFSILVALYGALVSYSEDSKLRTVYSILGLLFLLLGTISGMLVLFGLTTYATILPLCQIAFVIMQTCILSVEYHDSLNNIQKLSPELKNTIYELQNNKSTYISSHVKPDFLYETLDSISNYTGKNLDKVDELIQSLAKYLRQSLDFSVDPQNYSLKKELSNCEAYAKLVHEQHPEIRINFEYDKNLPDTTLPQLAILSLIENSVLYAFAEVLQPRIVVKAWKENDMIYVSVSDNGIGMNTATIKYALLYPNRDLSIGLYYIRQQLLDKWGTELQIKSALKKGTTITMCLGIDEVNNLYEQKVF